MVDGEGEMWLLVIYFFKLPKYSKIFLLSNALILLSLSLEIRCKRIIERIQIFYVC